MEDLTYLLEHCKTTTQTKTIETVIKHGSYRKAAAELKRSRVTLEGTVERVKRYANIYDSPGFSVKGRSTLYDNDGNVKIEWVKTDRDKEQDEQLLNVVKDTFQDYKGHAKLIKSPKGVNKDLLTIYPMGDPHLGMYAWKDETGDDFDCDIAERDLLKAISNLITLAPPSNTAIILNLGDFFHSDNQSNKTARSGNVLDVDTRWARVLQIGVNLMINCIELALQKHKKVIVKNLIGNHDDHTSQVLAIALDCFFHKNKRVEIDISPNKFWYFKFGKCLFGATHGDTAKPANLPNIMAVDRPKDWGDSEYRYFHTGHVHHDQVKDFTGCRFESHRTLAAKDAWHSASGYRSQRDMKCITYSRHYGEDSRYTMSLERLRQ